MSKIPCNGFGRTQMDITSRRTIEPDAASTGKWAMHVIGPDEIHEMPDELTALREASKLNKRIVKWRADDPSPHDPFMVALVKNLEVEEA